MNKNAITALVLLIEKYREQRDKASTYIEHKALRDVLEDLEELKDVLKKEKQNDK